MPKTELAVIPRYPFGMNFLEAWWFVLAINRREYRLAASFMERAMRERNNIPRRLFDEADSNYSSAKIDEFNFRWRVTGR